VSTTAAGRSAPGARDRAVHRLVRFSPHYYNTEEEAPLREMPGARMSAAEARAIDDNAHLEAYSTYLSALSGTLQPMAGADTPPGG
jgi:hypothetical protein